MLTDNAGGHIEHGLLGEKVDADVIEVRIGDTGTLNSRHT